MKKNYYSPELPVITIESVRVICASDFDDDIWSVEESDFNDGGSIEEIF